VEGAGVAVRAGPPDFLDEVSAASADREGDLIVAVPGGETPCRLIVTAEGFARRSIDRDPCLDDDPVEIELEPVEPLQVTVVGPRREPIAGAELRIAGPGVPGQWSGVTDGRGEVTVSGVPDGSWMLSVDHRDYRRASRALDLEHGVPRRVEVSLDAGTRWRGRVVGLRGSGQRARVILHARSERAEGRTGWGGSFTIDNGPSGSVGWIVMGGGLDRPCAGDILVPEGAPDWEAELDCDPGWVRIDGVVNTPDGAPAPGAGLTLSPTAGDGRRDVATTGGDGRFSFDEVVPGSYDLLWISTQGTVRMWSGYVVSDTSLDLVAAGGEAVTTEEPP
jgi:hypothetical protein